VVSSRDYPIGLTSCRPVGAAKPFRFPLRDSEKSEVSRHVPSERRRKTASGPGHFAEAIVCEILRLPFVNGLENETGNEFGLAAIGVTGGRSG
jgi:hypothetical protein